MGVNHVHKQNHPFEPMACPQTRSVEVWGQGLAGKTDEARSACGT